MITTSMSWCSARPQRCSAPRLFSSPPPRVHVRARRAVCSAAGSGEGTPFGMVLECDGVVLDTHKDGHREAFNRAFRDIGYDCIQWSPVIYDDLLRWGDGTGPGLIKAYFSKLGWPTMLSTKDRPAFVDKVYTGKVKALKDMVQAGDIPLRQGVAQFIDDALAEGCKVSILAGTSSAPQDSVLSSAMLNLGPSRALKLQTLTVGSDILADRSSSDEDEPLGAAAEEDDELAPSSFEKAVAAAQAAAKKEVAMSFVRAMHLKGVGMGLDPALQAAAERVGLVQPTLLAAVIATMGVPMERAAMVAANHSVMEAAKTAGMLVAAVPPSLSARGGYTAADASFDGYGPGGGLTWRKLKAIMEARMQRQQ